MLVLLRLYTVDVVTDMLTVVGSCILPVFEPDDTGKVSRAMQGFCYINWS